MADPSKTQKATPKRVREFRKRGDIALSRDLVSAGSLAGGFIGLVAYASTSSAALLDLTRSAMLAGGTVTDTGELRASALHTFAVGAAPALLGAAAGALLAMLPQLGWPPATKPIAFDLGKLDPFGNVMNIFGLAGMARRTGAALGKLVVIGAIVFFSLRKNLVASNLEAQRLGAVAWDLTRRAMWPALGVLGTFGAIDYFLARRRMDAQMKMSMEEIKRDHREQDGDPMVKGRRKQRMRELAKRRMAAAVATADVVVINPTHYAVALRYDEHKDAAPTVVAKGIDEQAEKIRDLARQHGIPILPRPPLARALHKHVKEGRAVPGNLYRAVAEVLAYVYKLKHGGAR
ncbi:MAG TPA: EscU/YscU/HrcU family type III secretion system export apparatus switch protein [Kofleriaceae bacterium]